MIGLRQALERGRKHPVLGPILLVLLALLLALVFLHAAVDGHDAATEVGALCIAIFTILGPILLERARLSLEARVVAARGDRGPPVVGQILRIMRPPDNAVAIVTPLRR